MDARLGGLAAGADKGPAGQEPKLPLGTPRAQHHPHDNNPAGVKNISMCQVALSTFHELFHQS